MLATASALSQEEAAASLGDISAAHDAALLLEPIDRADAMDGQHATVPSARSIAASAVDWRAGRAYVALSAAPIGSLRGRRPSVLQLALPSMSLVGASGPLGTSDMAHVSSLALGGDASETVLPPTWLHVLLASDSGTAAELVVLRLPQMQPTHSLRLSVTSPIRAAHYDARSAWLYLLCTGGAAAPHPTMLRIQMRGGQPAAAPGKGDVLTLPWAGALPLLLAFPGSRQLIALSDSGAEPPRPHYASAAPPRLCRIRLGTPFEDSKKACMQVHGRYSAEHMTTAAADDSSGVAYVGCRSGALFRLRLSPLVVDMLIRPSLSPMSAALYRPSDGALWLSTADGELLQLHTRARSATQVTAATTPPESAKSTATTPSNAPAPCTHKPCLDVAAGPGVQSNVTVLLPSPPTLPPSPPSLPSPPSPPSPPPPPAMSLVASLLGWVHKSLTPGQDLPIRQAGAVLVPQASTPIPMSPHPPIPSLSSPPPPPQPLLRPMKLPLSAQRTSGSGAQEQSTGTFWIHRKVGMLPTAVLMLLACFCGSQIGNALYKICRATCTRRPPPTHGFTKLP